MQSFPQVSDAAVPDSAATVFYQRITWILCLTILLVTLAAVAIPAGLGWDFANFYDTGRRVAAGQLADIYHPETVIAGAQPQANLAFWGTPLSAYFYTPLSLFTAPQALVLFKLQNVCVLFLSLWLLYRMNRRFVPALPAQQWRFAALFAGLVLLYQPFWSIYRIGGQTTPTLLLLFTIALLSHTRQRFYVSAGCLILALAIKPGFAFVLLPLCVVSGWAFLRALLSVSSVFVLVSILIAGWGLHAEFIAVMLRGMQQHNSWINNSSLFVFAENVWSSPDPSAGMPWLSIAVWLVKLSVLVLFSVLFRRSYKEGMPAAGRLHRDFLLSVAFGLMMMQTAWEHYLSALFPMLVYLAATQRTIRSGPAVLLAAIFVACLGQNVTFTTLLNPRLSIDTVTELIVAGLLKSSPLWLTLILLTVYWREWFQTYRMPQWREPA